MSSQPLVFLGGTSGRNPWRRGFMRRLVERGIGEQVFFDPVVADWNEAAREREEHAKAAADLLVFYLGDPQEPGQPLSAFSLVEVTLAVCREPQRTLAVFDLDAVQGHARKVYAQTLALLRELGTSALLLEDLAGAEEEIAKRLATGVGGR